MTKYQLITDLCESRAFRSKQAVDALSTTEKHDLLYAILLADIALAVDSDTMVWAQEYAGQTAAFSNFNFFRPSETDLYVLLYAATLEGRLDAVQTNYLIHFLKDVSKGSVNLNVAQQIFLRLERTFNISNSRLRSARRVVGNWASETVDSRKEALAQLILVIRKITTQAEILPYLKVLAKGEAGSFGVASTLKKAAALAGAGLAGMALGYHLHDPNRRWSIFHDDVENDKDTLTERRATDLAGIVLGLKDHPAVERVVAVHYIADGLTALVRTKDGNAYELQVRPAVYSRYHHDKTKKAVDEAESVGEEWEWSVQEAEGVNLTKYETDKTSVEPAATKKPVDAPTKNNNLAKGTKITLGRSPIINPHFRGKEGTIIGVLDNFNPVVYVVKTDFRLSPYHLYAEEFNVPQSQFYK